MPVGEPILQLERGTGCRDVSRKKEHVIAIGQPGVEQRERLKLSYSESAKPVRVRQVEGRFDNNVRRVDP